VHFHGGSCDSQGKVFDHLNDLVAKSDGVAETTTVIPNVDQAPGIRMVGQCSPGIR